MDGIVIVDKPEGFTSFDVCAVVRGLAREKHVGHTGTLDPMATGVLPVLLGRATKAAPLLPESGKTYEARFRLGERRDTGDATGKVVETSGAPVTEAALSAALGRFRGEILQVPPMMSAVSVNGARLYKLARQGVEVAREARPVTVFELTLLEYNEKEKTGGLRVRCSKGTYIRTLIEDVAAAAGSCGTMTALRRVEAAGFGIAEAVPLETLREAGDLSPFVRPVGSLFASLPRASVSEAQEKRYRNGGALALVRCRTDRTPQNGELCQVCREGRFLGLARREEDELRYVRSFAKENG